MKEAWEEAKESVMMCFPVDTYWFASTGQIITGCNPGYTAKVIGRGETEPEAWCDAYNYAILNEPTPLPPQAAEGTAEEEDYEPSEEDRVAFAYAAVTDARKRTPELTRGETLHRGLAELLTYSGQVAQYALRQLHTALRERDQYKADLNALERVMNEVMVVLKETKA